MKIALKTSDQAHNEGRHNSSDAKKENRVFPELKEFEHLRITPESDIPKPVPVITIAGEVISTEGNITTISGASKSGKSAFTGWILAGAISNTGILIDPLPDLHVAPNYSNKAVLHLDTEQAEHKQKSTVISIVRRAGFSKMPDYFLSYNIRKLSLNEYKAKTTKICKGARKEMGGLHLIIVDGIADYIKDVNDAESSNEIVKYFEDIAMEYKVPVVVILHTNPGSDKERGHLGSQLQRKSESVIHVKQEGEISHLEPKLLRMAGKGKIPQVQFMYDEEKGYHVSCGIKVGGVQDKDTLLLHKIEYLAKSAFAGGVAYKDSQAVETLMRLFNKGESTVKGYLKTMRAHKMIIQDTAGDKLWRLNLEYSF